MFEFIVCDDQVMFSKGIVKLIDSIFMKNSFDYTVKSFTDYNDNFEEIIKRKGSKIYILDIELNNGISGIDIARKIREYDWSSTIIMLTSHSEMGYDVLKAQIMVLDFISKFEDYKLKLTELIEKIIEKENTKGVIHYTNKGDSYRIDISNILYIVKEPLGRKCRVVTINGEYDITCTLNEIMQKLDENFYLTHRSCIVNTAYIEHVDWSNGIIIFDKGQEINLLSRERKKGLKNYVNV